MPKINHFEINADDIQRAKEFYEKVFNWKIERWGGPLEYWNISAGEEDEEGINGIFNYVGVESVEKTLKKIKENGGEILKPKNPIPSVGYYAVFKDTEGNQLGIMEEDENAK